MTIKLWCRFVFIPPQQGSDPNPRHQLSLGLLVQNQRMNLCFWNKDNSFLNCFNSGLNLSRPMYSSLVLSVTFITKCLFILF